MIWQEFQEMKEKHENEVRLKFEAERYAHEASRLWYMPTEICSPVAHNSVFWSLTLIYVHVAYYVDISLYTSGPYVLFKNRSTPNWLLPT